MSMTWAIALLIHYFHLSRISQAKVRVTQYHEAETLLRNAVGRIFVDF